MLTVLTSGIWQLSSVIVESAGQCLLVDPGFFPRELDELRRVALAQGRPVAVAFTHVHWDHVVGWQTFPEAEVWSSPALSEAIANRSEFAEKNLEKARDFDGRWYIERTPKLAWPTSSRALRDGEELRFGGGAVTSMSLPGHSVDGLGLLLHEERALLVGDYLSPCEIPFVEDLAAYRATLLRLKPEILRCDVVIPGHGPKLSRSEAIAIAEEDLAYLDELSRAADRQDASAATTIRLPRAENAPGMRDHHVENCRAAGVPHQV